MSWTKRSRKPILLRVAIVSAFSLVSLTRVDAFLGQSSSLGPLQFDHTFRYHASNLQSRRIAVFNAGKGQEEKTDNTRETRTLSPGSHDPIIVADEPEYDIRYASPLLEFGYPPAVNNFEEGTTSSKPLLLYVPGFDGTYLSAFFQYPELHSIFEVRCLVSTMEDRSTFDKLKQSILKFIECETRTETDVEDKQKRDPVSEEEQKTDVLSKEKTSFSTFLSGMMNHQKQDPSATTSKSVGRPVYLAGESFGGVLACEVALALFEDTTINFQGLTLINAATCYDRSRLAAEGPPVTRLPKFLYVFGILKLLPMFLDEVSFPQLLAIVQGNALPSLIDNPTREAYMGRFALALPTMLKFMPQETFQWRLEEWLVTGCQRMEKTLPLLAAQATKSGLKTLIVAGENDLTLPSIAEAERLAQLLPNSHVHVVPAVGHANTCGTCLDLAAEMRSHFPELLPQQSSSEEGSRRTAMKEVASQGEGIYYGMEPRYDGNKIGLSPLKYWSNEYYRKAKLPSR